MVLFFPLLFSSSKFYHFFKTLNAVKIYFTNISIILIILLFLIENLQYYYDNEMNLKAQFFILNNLF